MFALSHIKPPHLATALVLTLLAGLTLPVVPLWSGLIYAIGLLSVLTFTAPSRGLRAVVIGILIVTIAAMLGAHALSILGNPIQYFKVSFDQQGIDYPLLAGVWVVGVGIALILYLGRLQIKTTSDRLEKFAAASLVAFAISYHLPTLLALNTPDLLVMQLSALIKWNSWVIAALLAMGFARTQSDFAGRVLGTVVTAGLIVGVIVILQHLTREHFYVLEARDFAAYEFRVRASYTYHAPAAFLLALATLIEACKLKLTRNAGFAKLAVLCLALSLNETRAVSLGLAGGMFVVGAYHLYGRAPIYRTLICLAIAALFAAQVSHIKTNANIAPPDATESASGATDDTPSYVESNNPRRELLQEGLHTLRGLWVGQGVGTISIPLSGYNNKGQMSAWSSHSFLVDVGLAGGIFSLLLFMAFIGAGAVRTLLYLWQNRHNKVFAAPPLALIGCSISWGLVSIFLPQEANYLLPLMFMCAALSVCSTTVSTETKEPAKPLRIERAARYVLIVGALGWSIVFSGTMFIPLVELAKLRHENPETAEQKIYTNSPKLRWLSQHVIRPVYPALGNIETLPQTPDVAEEMWLLWDPSYDHRYGAFLDAQGRNYHRGYGHFPIFNLPQGWEAKNRLQPTLSILHSGASRVQVNPGEEEAKYELYYPNFAPWSRISDDTANETLQLSDGHYTSFIELSAHGKIMVDAGAPRALDAYSITLSHQPDLPAYKTLSWTLEGSNDRHAWRTLSSERDVTFTVEPIEDRFFHPKVKQAYRYYRLSFNVVKPVAKHAIYISDMKLFSATPKR